MKIRQGFVSNSSSSSFCIIGVRVTDEPMEMLKSTLKINNEDIFAKMASENTTETIEDFCSSWLDEILEDSDIDYIYSESFEGRIIGSYVASWEYESSEHNAMEEFENAKKKIEAAGLSADNMKIFVGTDCC